MLQTAQKEDVWQHPRAVFPSLSTRPQMDMITSSFSVSFYILGNKVCSSPGLDIYRCHTQCACKKSLIEGRGLVPLHASYRVKIKYRREHIMSERIVIVGASIAGLATALALNRTGHDVIVLERDDSPPLDLSCDVFAHWQRRGVPQLRHSHGFLACLRKTLRDHEPDLLVALRKAGAREYTFRDSLPPSLAQSYRPRPGDDDLTSLFCRRSTFEMVLYDYACAKPGIDIRTGVQATGVLSKKTHTGLQLTGLTAKGHCQFEIAADVIIDATGRSSPFLAWLRRLGAVIEEESHDTGIVYYSRFYHLRPGCSEPSRTRYSSLGDLGYLKYGVFPADNGTFSLTLAVPTVETDLRILRHADAFTEVCKALPALAPWIAPERAEPMTQVFQMGGLRDTYRCAVVNQQPATFGYFAVGESAVHTNPLYGRGCSLSVLHAYLLADVLHREIDPAARAMAYHHQTQTHLRPFYDVAVRRDQASQRHTHAAIDKPTALTWRQRLRRSMMLHGLAPAIRGDLEVRRAFVRDFHMLAPPGLALKRLNIALRILRFWLRGAKRNQSLYAPPAGPKREDMRRILGLSA